MSDDATDDLRTACQRVLASFDLGLNPLQSDIRTVHSLCAASIENDAADTRKITNEILSVVFSKSTGDAT